MSYASDMMGRLGLTRCPLCPGDHPVVPSDGPISSPFLFIGEMPGQEEDSRGRCFIGKTGKEFNDHYLPLAGMTRNDIRITNCTRCLHKLGNENANAKKILASCTDYHLKREMAEQQPVVVIPMGAIASSLVDDMNLEMYHGLPVENVEWWGNRVTVFPTNHPAAGLHDTDMILSLRNDFINLGKYLHGSLHIPVDEYAGREEYFLLNGANETIDILLRYGQYDVLAMDTEYDWDGIWCLTFSMRDGTGYMIRRSDKPGLLTFIEWLNWHKGTVCFHNGMADIPKLQEVDIVIPPHRFDDTMVRAYHLQWLPQALKILAFRLCGMKMKEFNDVVLPYSTDVMMTYILQLLEVDWGKPEKQTVSDGKGGWKEYQAQGLNPKMKRLTTDFLKNPTHKVFDRWGNWSEEEKAPAVGRFGPMPRASIRYVPMKEAVVYACRDADATLRVRKRLIQLKRQIRRPEL